MERSSHSVLERAERLLFGGAVVFVFLSFQVSSYPLALLLLWSAVCGVIFAYVLFRVISQAPNILVHLRRLHRKPRPLPDSASVVCPVCGQCGCKRHWNPASSRDFLQPWDDLAIPGTVDAALSEFLEIVLERFVYSWHTNLAQDESFVDELRVAIRYTAAAFLRRAQKVDIPALVTGEMLKAAAAHVHIYQLARRKLPRDASVAAIESAVFQEYGDHTHTAMRGGTGELRYFRHLTGCVMPHLLPSEALESKIMRTFIQELFTTKVFMPAMSFAAKPDFINKLLLIIFDKNSRLRPLFGPPCLDVPLLGQFARRRASPPFSSPLHTPLSLLLSSQTHLYAFMQFLKSQGTIHVLQVYLSIGELNNNVQNPRITQQQAQSVIPQVETLHCSYLQPSVPNHIPLDPQLAEELASILSSEGSALEKCEQLKQQSILERVGSEAYKLLEEIYLPRFHLSYEFFHVYIGRGSQVGEDKSSSATPPIRRMKRWRSRARALVTAPSMEQVDALGTETSDSETGRDSPVACHTPPPPSPTASPLCHVQIVDMESRSDGIKPYTVFTILTRRGKEDTKSSVETVKRRFKEFVGLDTKLRQFYGDTGIQLPSKKPFRNMDRGFVESRRLELEQYLTSLISLPRIQDSQLLISFLTDSSDPALFMPDSVGNKAGKMIKAVPSKLKREKSQLVEDFLQSLLASVDFPPPQASPQTVAEVTEVVETNRKTTERYYQEVEEDLSHSEVDRPKPWLREVSFGEPLQLDGLMDLLVYLAVHVYHASQWQLTVLLLLKLLGQNTVEAVTYDFIAWKVALMESEGRVVDLIHLLRDILFFDTDPPRTPEQVCSRQEDTLAQLLTYPPPLLVRALGGQRWTEGTALLFEMLQCHQLNKQLFFTLLDIIVLELFPELRKGGTDTSRKK